MTTLAFTHPVFARHEVPPGHAEHGGRIKAVMDALGGPAFEALERRVAHRATPQEIESVHTKAYCRAIEDAAPAEGYAKLDADTFMGPSSLDAAMRAAGAAVAATDAVFSGAAQNAFIAARPPGHHAEPMRAMGFCIFNTAAIGAMRARAHGARRIAVVDFDVHHGNGTQTAFWNDECAFFASSHEWPLYPGTGMETERGAFENIANVRLKAGDDGLVFRRAWGETLLPALSDFEPDFIVMSAGFDAHEADPLGGLRLLEADFAWITGEIAAIARDKTRGRMISVLEGGYDLEALAGSVAAHVEVLMRA